MGKKKRAHQQNHKSQKRRKIGRYWIEDCVELLPPPDKEVSIVITISRVTLVDNHSHGSEGKAMDPKKSIGIEQSDHSCTSEKDPAPLDTIVSATSLKAQVGFDGLSVDPSFPTVRASATLDIPVDQAFVAIQRAQSAKEPLKQFEHQAFKPLPNGDRGDGVPNPHDKRLVHDKYWAQRKRFFSRFDEGICLDKEGWYSVTPEVIANHIANRVVAGKEIGSMLVMDAFCGCGGNTVAYANRPEVALVIAIDVDRAKLKLAANNAAVYNVSADKIRFIHGNAYDALRRYKNGKRLDKATEQSEIVKVPMETEHGFQIGGMDLLPENLNSIFLSPPWGGMDYESCGKRNFHIETCIEVNKGNGSTWNGEELLLSSAIATNGSVVYFLPRNINGISLGRSGIKAKYCALEMEQNILNDKLKTVTAYFGL